MSESGILTIEFEVSDPAGESFEGKNGNWGRLLLKVLSNV